jgi:hypothetical protein
MNPEPQSSNIPPIRKSSPAPVAAASALLTSIIAVNILNYANTVTLGRWLGPADYSAYAAMLALFLVLTLLPLTWQQVSARFTASQASARSQIGGLAFGSSLLVTLGFLIACPWLATRLNLPWWWLAAIGLILPLYGLLGVQRGILQATNTTRLGMNLLLEPVIKILATVALWSLVTSVNATVLGLLASVLAALAWTDRRNLERL